MFFYIHQFHLDVSSEHIFYNATILSVISSESRTIFDCFIFNILLNNILYPVSNTQDHFKYTCHKFLHKKPIKRLVLAFDEHYIFKL